MVVGGSYLNPVNNHKYSVAGITIDAAAVTGTPPDATLPLADAAVWLTNGTTFNVTEVTDVVLTVTDMGPTKAWGQFVVGRVFDSARTPPAGAADRVRVTAITVAGLAAALPAGAIVWAAEQFDSAGGLIGTVTATAEIVQISSVRVGSLPAGATVMLGDEIVNSLSHRGYRVDVIKVATVSVAAASARLPGDALALWLTDLTTFDVTMPAAARASMVLSVTDEGLVVPANTTGGSMDQPELRTNDTEYITTTFATPPGADWAQVAQAADTGARNQHIIDSRKIVKEETRAHFARFMEYFPKKYAAKMDWVRAIAGIPPKSDASSAGSPCWRDFGDSYWWEDVEGFYLPAFTNRPFISAKRNADGSIVSTREFGFGLITQCGNRLKEGDRITIKIAGSSNQAYWAEGDRFVIPLIAAASAPLTGGADGDPTQTWTVRSTVLGALADWAWLASAPTPWAHAPATVDLSPGGIAFEVGDSVAFDIEGGALRWRRDAGAWTTGDLYGAAPLELGDGLQLQAVPGAAPSFLGGDTWQFSAVATHGVARMRQPRIGQAFAWDGAAVTLDIDLVTAQPLEAVMLALHGIAADATVVIAGGLADTTDWSLPADVRPGIILAVLPRVEGDPPTQARYLRVTITGAGAGGSVGWLWAGMGWQPTVGPSRMTIKRQYGLSRSAGINAAALYRGVGTGGRWSWNLDSGAALLADNAAALMELIDYSAAQGLEPMALVPDLRVSAGASVALIDADEIEMDEFSNWQDQTSRVVSLELPLRAVLA